MSRRNVGELAPAFCLINQNGQEISSDSLRGQRYVLYFYPKDDTPGCTVESCQFNESLPDFTALDVQVFGISPDNQESHTAFREKFSLGFDLLCDPDTTTMAAYGAYGDKVLYGKKTVGVIRSTFVVGPTGLIEHAWYGVKTDGHAARVKKAIAG